MNNLTFISVVERDDGLSDLMVQSIRRFKPDARIIIIDNAADDRNARLKEYGAEVYKYYPQAQGGSLRHGLGLNQAWHFHMMRAPTEYTVIVDSDFCLLSGNWEPEKTLSAAPKNGKQTGTHHLYFCVLRTEAFKDIDFRPRPPLDTGCAIQSDDLELLEHTDCKLGKGRLFDSRFQCDEIAWQGELIGSHYGRGSNLAGKIQKTALTHTEQLRLWKAQVEEIIGDDK